MAGIGRPSKSSWFFHCFLMIGQFRLRKSSIFAKDVCNYILNNESFRGLLICGSGVGMSIAANKIKGIRASNVVDEFIATQSVEHNNVNVLCLGSNNINIRAIAQGASERNISIMIDKKNIEKALNTLHESFFEAQIKELKLFITGVGNVGKRLINPKLIEI